MSHLPKCSTPWCRHRARNQRSKCHTCRGRLYAAAHPDIVAFNNLKKSARRRGHEFSLTIGQFREFAVRYDYLNKRGKHAEGFTVNRIDADEGYHIWNLEVITNSANVIQEHVDRKRAFAMVKIYGWSASADNPF